jgi:exonuclease III
MVVKRKLLLSLLLALNVVLSGQNQIRVMSYNLLNYPNSKDVYFNKIITQINPDALVVVEMISQAGINQFLINSLSAEYSTVAVNILSSDVYGNNGNDCGFYYKSNILTLIEYKAIPARTRVISEFKLVHNITKDTLIIFGVHLKAYPEPENQDKRLSTVNTLRTRTLQLKPTANYIVAGDFNIFTSTEPAFQRLLDQSSPGYVNDPQNAVGNWTDNSSFSHTHTYSPSYLKSRLDMILISEAINKQGGIDLVDYKIFGNDGIHFATSITNGSNSWFSDISIGNALIYASDHLPVYADFNFGVPTNVPLSENIPTTFELKQNYPNPFNPTTVISYQLSVSSHVKLTVFDLLGREVSTLVNEEQKPGNYNSQFSIHNSQLSSGVYFYQLKAGALVQTKKMVLLR